MESTGIILDGSFAAPEQCGGAQSCIQTDVYGLGTLLFYMINRRAPYTFLEPLNIYAYNNSYGDGLPRVVIRAMSLDIRRRFSSMKEMREQLNKNLLRYRSIRDRQNYYSRIQYNLQTQNRIAAERDE